MSSWFGGMVTSMKGMLGGTEQLEVEQGGGNENSERKEEEKQSLWKQMSGYLGKDISSLISLPVWVFEPISFLQIMAEPLQFEELLEKAGTDKDALIRLAYLSAFVTAGHSVAVRNKKAFNPLLGETFHFVPKDNKWKLFAEQVSHHPPIGVTTVESDSYKLHLEMDIKTKLNPNSIDVVVSGTNAFEVKGFGDKYEWGHIETCAHNTIIGGMWVDHFGVCTIVNTVSGEKAVLNFSKCGYFGSGRFEVNGEIFDKNGKAVYKVSAKWNEFFNITKVEDGSNAQPRNLWTKEQVPLDKWNFPPFTQSLNVIENEKELFPMDSRLRTDRLNLEKNDLDTAGKEKTRLEEVQRAKRKELEAAGDHHVPRFYKKSESENGPKWVELNNYWEEQSKLAK
eukprot:TRINITY_DN233_c0_g1_i1.p1 TRINITY_DN233_c0_g1~~TRINITY_DN233_c0_g1_i1.p1  ORF type:complete len:395 (+),score=164.29 TRINITY_DN233_c0_g1_i1:188-1372(+)